MGQKSIEASELWQRLWRMQWTTGKTQRWVQDITKSYMRNNDHILMRNPNRLVWQTWWEQGTGEAKQPLEA